MDFPASASRPIALPEGLVDGFGGLRPKTVLAGPDLMAVFEHEADVASLTPDFAVLACLDARGVIATAPGDSSDFVSRCFFPKLGVNEDPVTGSAHCQMGPYWAERLGRVDLGAHQLSARSGRVDCRVRGERVELLGQAMTYLVGTLRL